ncbi:Copper chaperone CopZ OS=Lysinibacillus sphaericus OX=1421 GN=copZ PE=4 SV=1 [Lysinibacillus sphaericus]
MWAFVNAVEKSVGALAGVEQVTVNLADGLEMSHLTMPKYHLRKLKKRLTIKATR